jgi:TonB-dependent starch-binding outer membrane protein SusC
MKKIFIFLNFIIFSALCVQSIIAQVTITGTISDENQQPLPGVNVVVKGTSRGTLTDNSGKYSISVDNQEAVLVFSYVGYIAKEESVGNRTLINVSLAVNLEQMEEIVVVGYGTQKKSDLTGSVAVVSVEDLSRSTSTNLTDRLQGRIAGVSVTTTGQPGSVGDIKIRGTSFFGDNYPLFVVDGVLTDDSPNLNPYDIESVQVLKDASSSAIYGSRAANGVVVITTKRGKAGKPAFNISSEVGFQQIPNRIDLTNNFEFARINNAAHDNSFYPRDKNCDVNFDPELNTDWQDVMFNNKALTQNYNASLSGGGENYHSYFSLNYSNTEGTIIRSVFDRITARVNTDYKPWKKLTLGQNLTVSRVHSSGLSQQYGQTVISGTLNNLPIIPVYDSTKPNGYGYGQIGVATCYVPNPLGQQELITIQDQSDRILGNAFLDLDILEGLNYHFSIGINTIFNHSKDYNPHYKIRMATEELSRLTESRDESTEVFLENRLTYTKSFGGHNFSVMVTHTEQEINGADQESESKGGYETEPYYWVLSASSTPVLSNGSEFSSAIRSYLGRLTYNFKDRYLLTGIIRRDGSSKFAPENRWGTFPSLSAGWNIAKENFFHVNEISEMKIRAGYGIVGNSSIGDYVYQSLVVSTSSVGAGGVNYNLGPGGALFIGATRGTLVNRDISWEILKETNIGLDLKLFKNKLEFNADYYIGKLEGLLTEVPVPMSIGPGEGEVTVNAVNMKRNGWEANLTYRKVFGDFRFSVSANFFHTRNEITYLPFGVDEFPGENSTSRLGIPLGQLFLVEYLGIYTSQEQIVEDNVTINGQVPVVGDARYRDVDGRDEEGNLTGEPDGNISFDDDRQLWGNPIPYMQYGFNFDGSWKNLDLYLFFQGVTKRDVYNSIYANLNTAHDVNYTADYDPYIDGKGTDPRPVLGLVANNFESTRFVENGAYLKLKNLQIGYNIPLNKIQKLRVYVSGQNLFVITKYRGMDPEFEGGVFEPGIDPIDYPQVRTFLLGINLTI